MCAEKSRTAQITTITQKVIPLTCLTHGAHDLRKATFVCISFTPTSRRLSATAASTATLVHLGKLQRNRNDSAAILPTFASFDDEDEPADWASAVQLPHFRVSRETRPDASR